MAATHQHLYGPPHPASRAAPKACPSSTGVRRVSVGTAITQAAYTLAHRAATELLTTGTYAELDTAIDFATINNLFTC